MSEKKGQKKPIQVYPEDHKYLAQMQIDDDELGTFPDAVHKVLDIVKVLDSFIKNVEPGLLFQLDDWKKEMEV